MRPRREDSSATPRSTSTRMTSCGSSGSTKVSGFARRSVLRGKGRRSTWRSAWTGSPSASPPSTPAVADHGLNPDLSGRPVEIVLWTDDADRDHARLTAEGAPSLSAPHDFLADLRLAWVADPDGNPIQLA